MGGCQSAVAGGGGRGPLLERSDGGQAAFAERFITDRVLGEGEFGQVKLVHEAKTLEETTNDHKTNYYACKTLKKGPVFKNNTLYPPIPPEILRGEVEMLRKLNGEKYCLKLIAIFETPKALLVVTDYCTGGEMMEYVSKQTEDIRTEDVSRISFQLLSAVDHCAKNNIIHRDIKPENTMFLSEESGAELRLIDFGSGTNKVVSSANDGMHTTFAGTPFYNSPEMFQKTYTSKTDVWSVGVVLYVLVAGYPSECLQKAFNILMDSKRSPKKEGFLLLPNLPDDMPDSYYELLDELLKYRHKMRKPAGEILYQSEFARFHKDLLEGKEEKKEDTDDDVLSELPSHPKRRTASVYVRGSVKRHSLFIDFKKFERSLTTLLATMLNQDELTKLISIIEERHSESENDAVHHYLQVVSMKELKDMLQMELDRTDCWERIKTLNDFTAYENHAYHSWLLKEFVALDNQEHNRTWNINNKRSSMFVKQISMIVKPSATEDSQNNTMGRVDKGNNNPRRARPFSQSVH